MKQSIALIRGLTYVIDLTLTDAVSDSFTRVCPKSH
jgi:hypothetical protein